MKQKNKKWLVIGIIILLGILYLNYDYTSTKIKNKIIAKEVDQAPGVAPAGTRPLILLHGFNPLSSSRIAELSFKEMQKDIEEDLGYVNKGLLTDTTTCAELRYSQEPIVIRASYFEKMELAEVEEYTQNLNEIINVVLNCTGAEQVDVITHSMGGIVVRQYLKTINNKTINTVVMLGTPNKGGLYNVGKSTNWFIKEGESKINVDVLQLSENHEFMQELNSENETFPHINYYTIAGNFDGKGDGIVLEESVKLNGVPHLTVKCEHISLKHPSLCPEAYELVKIVFKK
ncbi:alpha/beta hydrolase [Candidatus Woesearchaeota archaeon]|nr:alpha/beta hydrolase [Candidatus Woesearchaeota archaeon]MBT4367948.1 alpha/beta hydrolase [Candidatus Woesearchaeota archaeon]MBT4712436.1 alpha/beta hydrolase [Candidatus Woesearchaeota archaeon]MBT6639348.1 alpha/beta hydrolase [Candidatus Woesearchaeota archaeon]MBT7133521.1 alpha/beta hydrolase [Candidatus Woesearchaeota archaeon]